MTLKAVANIFLLGTSFALAAGITGCTGFNLPSEAYQDVPSEALSDAQDLTTWDIDPLFEFASSTELPLTVSVLDNQGQPVSSFPVDIFYSTSGDTQYRYVMSGATNEEGIFGSCIHADLNIDTILFETTYPGYPARQLLPVLSGELSYTFDPHATPLTLDVFDGSKVAPSRMAPVANEIDFNYIGTYNTIGVPDYLEPEDDEVGQSILDLIAASLPEGQPVPQYNPQYISSGNSASLIAEEDMELWITFVHEGAGYRNALGYYTYPTSNPPSDVAEISSFSIVFPNVSFSGSGGGLNSGNKVYLGSFPAGTSVGWFLVPNGWSPGEQQVVPQPGKDIKFSNNNLNTFTSAQYSSHSVILEDAANETLYLGFEDINRPGGDNDFNDAVFYLTATPYTSVNTDGLPQALAVPPDSDGDGTPDIADDFLDDPEIAFATHVPGEGVYGTLAFEDMWPSTGDYDMNDMVIDYNFIDYRNSNNLVIKSRATFVIKAMGAGLRNGFGYATNLSPSDVQSVNGQEIYENYVDIGANGVETGQSNAVFIAFDNGVKAMGNPLGFVNTDPSLPFVSPDTVQLDITYSNPLQAGSIGAPPYNPFIMTGLRRGHEVHLADMAPTDKADQSLLGTSSDDSDPASDRYYRTRNNLPWALNFASGFDYPLEKQKVNTAYNHFFSWVSTSGLTYPDWYYNINGYRNLQFIY